MARMADFCRCWPGMQRIMNLRCASDADAYPAVRRPHDGLGARLLAVTVAGLLYTALSLWPRIWRGMTEQTRRTCYTALYFLGGNDGYA